MNNAEKQLLPVTSQSFTFASVTNKNSNTKWEKQLTTNLGKTDFRWGYEKLILNMKLVDKIYFSTPGFLKHRHRHRQGTIEITVKLNILRVSSSWAWPCNTVRNVFNSHLQIRSLLQFNSTEEDRKQRLAWIDGFVMVAVLQNGCSKGGRDFSLSLSECSRDVTAPAKIKFLEN